MNSVRFIVILVLITRVLFSQPSLQDDVIGKTDPLVNNIIFIGDYFNTKPYYADKRHYVEADLAIPYELREVLQQSEISYLGLLRNEIFARKGYIFTENIYQKIFDATAWYNPGYKDVAQYLTSMEIYNINFIKKYEMQLLIKGERSIIGWDLKNEEKEYRKTYLQNDRNSVHNKGELKIIKVSKKKVKIGEKVHITLKVKNLGTNIWEPIGLSKTQEAGKYYISSCWIDSERKDTYAVIDQIPLPNEIGPGMTSIIIKASVEAPMKPGIYALTFSILQSMVQRFLLEPLSSARFEYDHCPKVMIKVIDQ